MRRRRSTAATRTSSSVSRIWSAPAVLSTSPVTSTSATRRSQLTEASTMFGQGHYYCQNCGHAVQSRYGGCRTCMTPLSELMLLDDAQNQGLAGGSIGFDPVDDSIAFNLGDGLAIEPDGQLDIDVGGFDIPI